MVFPLQHSLPQHEVSRQKCSPSQLGDSHLPLVQLPRPMPQLALATFVTMLPLLVVFIGAQRFLMRGQTVGAVKG